MAFRYLYDEHNRGSCVNEPAGYLPGTTPTSAGGSIIQASRWDIALVKAHTTTTIIIFLSTISRPPNTHKKHRRLLQTNKGQTLIRGSSCCSSSKCSSYADRLVARATTNYSLPPSQNHLASCCIWLLEYSIPGSTPPIRSQKFLRKRSSINLWLTHSKSGYFCPIDKKGTHSKHQNSDLTSRKLFSPSTVTERHQ